MINYTMFPNKRALLNLSNSYILAHRKCYLSPDKYVVCFSSTPDSDKGGATCGKLSESIESDKGDATMEGSAGGYGGSGVSSTGNNSPSTAQEGGHGGFGTPMTNDRRRREDEDMEDAARDAAETAKAGVVGAIEIGLKFGEMAKETMDSMWDAAKENTENVRDAVADDGDDDDNDRRNEGTDKHVEDLRRMARGYDLKDD